LAYVKTDDKTGKCVINKLNSLFWMHASRKVMKKNYMEILVDEIWVLG
jgi:hypothetical protein